MIRKICPICDQTMTSAHYCRNCRSWVRQPIVREVTYYLNERHPARETDCSYHTLTKKPAQHRSKPVPPVRTSSASAHRDRGYAKSFASLLLTGVILVAVTFFQSCVSADDGFLTDLLEPGTHPGEDESMQEVEYQELTDEEVKKAGIACSSAAHFDVSGAELVRPMMRILEQQGVEICGTNTYSYNESCEDGTTWYGTWTSIDLQEGEQGGYQYVTVEYDTATGDLHQINMALEGETILADTAADVLELLEKLGALQEHEQCAGQVREELAEAAQGGNGYQLECDRLYVEGIAFDTCYRVTIMRSMP
ncbi:MAG: hypothetical protein MR868_11240 [Lachnospiraceae bacterium]|nr:hypothetical protein [Lachnospiraceae bacterium]